MKQNYLEQLREIKSVAMASVDHNNHPQVRIIDIMLVENQTLYFCTAKGKNFYQELMQGSYVSILGMTKEYQSIRLCGKAIHLTNQHKWIDKIFEHNPIMNTVYPGDSRYILEPFCIKDYTIEYFDLSTTPINRYEEAVGSVQPLKKGFTITDACIGCGKCQSICPQKCIISGTPYKIQSQHCLHCGLCAQTCPMNAIKNQEGYE